MDVMIAARWTNGLRAWCGWRRGVGASVVAGVAVVGALGVGAPVAVGGSGVTVTVNAGGDLYDGYPIGNHHWRLRHRRSNTVFYNGFRFNNDFYDGREDRYSPLYLDTATLVQLARRLDPALVDPNGVATPAERDSVEEGDEADVGTAETSEENARRAMREGRYDEAAKMYSDLADRQRREEDGAGVADGERDGAMLRLAGVAQAANGEFEVAAGTVSEAYEVDESLGKRPLRGLRYFEDERDLKRVVQRAVMHAHRVETREAWTLVAVLMHAEGRHRVAERMIERAEAAAGSAEAEIDRGEREEPSSHTDVPDDLPGMSVPAEDGDEGGDAIGGGRGAA